MTTRDTFLALADARLADAQTLLRAGRFGAAYYLAGYAIECALKARIALRFREAEFPDRSFANDVFTHDLERLVRLAGLKERLDAMTAGSPAFKAKWGVVVQWSESSRYAIIDEGKAHTLVAAIADEAEGVLPWLKSL